MLLNVYSTRNAKIYIDYHDLDFLQMIINKKIYMNYTINDCVFSPNFFI